MYRSILLTVLGLAGPSAAQIALAPYGGYDVAVPHPLVGVAGEVGLLVSAPVALALRASGEKVSPAEFTRASDGRLFNEQVLQAGVDVLARLGCGAVRPYTGLGVAVTFTELDTWDDDTVEGDQDASRTSVGATVLGGALLGLLGPVSPFVEMRGTLASARRPPSRAACVSASSLTARDADSTLDLPPGARHPVPARRRPTASTAQTARRPYRVLRFTASPRAHQSRGTLSSASRPGSSVGRATD